MAYTTNPGPVAPGPQEDDDVWETLDTPLTNTAAQPEDSSPNTTSSSTALAVMSTTSRQSSSNKNTTTAGDSVLTLRRRVETRQTLQRHLVHHPLQIFWSHFLWHLAHEFFNLDIKIRFAVLFLSLGVSCKVFMMMTWYLYYPKMILMSLILLISWVYLYPDDIMQRLESFFTSLAVLPHRIPQALEHMDIKQARIVCMVGFFVPTLLQARTITALADINATGGSLLWVSFMTVVLVGGSFFLVSPPRSRAARDVSQICLVVLYGSAIWITLCHFRILTLPRLAAPFFLSTGTLLLAYEDNDSMEWCSGLVRSALRLTLRDVLASIGTSVQEDEMLQLALLRWIVDYWSYTPPRNQPQSQPTEQTTTTTPLDQELQWDELFPMLDTATDQMTSEMQTLQQQQDPLSQHTTGQAQTNPPSPEAGTASGNNTGNPVANENPLKNLHSMLVSMNVDHRAKPAVEAYKHKVENFPPSREMALVISIIRRCPGCIALLWQVFVASMFQPATTTMTFIMMLTPMAALDVLRIQAWMNACESLSRMLDGINAEASHPETASSSQSTWTKLLSGVLKNILPNADPMTILFSGDDDVMQSTVVNDSEESTTTVTTQVKIPTLLVVWRNMKSSVSALESSLTAARCMQTGAIALEFTQNVISLAHFGNEVHKHGWMHGLTLIAKEVVFQHQGDINSAPRAGSPATFTYAAVRAMRNGQQVVHNLGVLADDEGPVGHIIAPIVGFFEHLGGIFNHQQNTVSEEEPSSEENADAGEDSEERDGAHSQGSEKPDVPDSPDSEWEATTTTSNIQQQVSHRVSSVVEEVLPPSPKKEEQTTGTHGVEELSTDEQPLSEIKSKDADLATSNAKAPTPEAPTEVHISEHLDEKLSSLGDVSNVSTVDTKSLQEPPAASARTDVVEDSLEESKVEIKTYIETSKATEGKETAKSPSDEKEGSTEELGIVMELIAEAYERSMIDESEKNAFCLKLSEGGNDEVFVSGMKATLQGLLLETSHDGLETSADTTAVAAAPDTIAAEAQSVSLSLESSPVRTSEQKTARTPDQSPGTGESKTDSDGGWSPIIASTESEEATIQPLDYGERIASAVRTSEAMAARPNVATTTEEDDDGIPTVASSPAERKAADNDNDWVKLGMGIAGIGAAMVGAAILAGNNADNSSHHDRDRNASYQPSGGVTIERLDDEEEDAAGNEEWETTAQ